MSSSVLQFRDIVKKYPGIIALKGVNVDVVENTIHCIVGENGAGKSTFIKILTGAIQRDAGTIILKGKEYAPHTPRDAIKAGISTIFQELNVVDQLSVEENLTLGLENSIFGVIRKSDETTRVFQVLKRLEPRISLRQKVSKLSVAQKQIIEISKALAADASIVVMDEPTAALSEDEVTRLFQVIEGLKHERVTIVYITHRLEEIFEIGDYVSVFRDGEVIATRKVEELANRSELIKLMIGKIVTEHYEPRRPGESAKALEVINLSTKDMLRGIDFTLFAGEILGFYGLVGSGKSEIARVLYGADRIDGGEVRINGRRVSFRIPSDSIRRGIALVPEDRRNQGIFGDLSIRDNICIMNPKKISRFGVTQKRKEKAVGHSYIKKLCISTRGTEQQVSTLSGGNQQKVVLSKCLNTDPRILILDEPTRGIDVGAKEEIHGIIRQLSRQGNSILVFSSELPEILNLCDRIVLLFDGHVKTVIRNGEMDNEQIMHIATGG